MDRRATKKLRTLTSCNGDELVREHKAGTRDNSDYIRRLIRSIKEEHETSTALDAQLEKAHQRKPLSRQRNCDFTAPISGNALEH